MNGKVILGVFSRVILSAKGLLSRAMFSAEGSFGRAMPLVGGSLGTLTIEELAMVCRDRAGQLASLVIGERLSAK